MGFFDKLFGNKDKEPKITKRTPFNLKVKDVVSYDLEDYIVIGKIVYRSSGYEWYDYHLDNGSKKIWLSSEDDDEIILGIFEKINLSLTDVPNQIEYNGETFKLDEHGKANISLAEGRVGTKTGNNMEYWDFESDQGNFLSVEKWGNEIEVSYGYPIDPHELDFLPGGE